MKRARRKPLIKFEYRNGTFEGGIYDPPFKNEPWEKIYFKMDTSRVKDVFRMTADEAATMIACLGIALNQSLSVKKSLKKKK